MNYKQKFLYFVAGAIVMLIGLGIGAIVSPPLTAQNNGVFDRVICSELFIGKDIMRPGILMASDPAYGNYLYIHQATGNPDKAAITIGSGIKGTNQITLNNPANKEAINFTANPKLSALFLSNPEGTPGVVLACTESVSQLSLLRNKTQDIFSLAADRNRGTVGMNFYDRRGKTRMKLGHNYDINIYGTYGNTIWQTPE